MQKKRGGQFVVNEADASCAKLTAAIPITPVMSAAMIANILRIGISVLYQFNKTILNMILQRNIEIM